MAGLFGGRAAAFMPVDAPAQPMTWADRLAILGAGLKDASPGSQGGNLAAQQQLMGLRAKQAQQQAFLKTLMGKLQPTYQDGPPMQVSAPAGLIGGQAAQQPDLDTIPTPPGLAPQPEPAPGPAPYQLPRRTSDGLNMNSPELPGLAIQAEAMGVPITTLLEVLKGQQPHMVATSDGRYVNDKDASLGAQRFANRANVNGTIADLNDPSNTNRVISEAPVKGAMPVYDNLGRVTDWRLPPGVEQAVAANAQAQQTGQTRGTMLNVPLRGGGSRMMLGGQYLGGQGAAGGAEAGPGGLGTSQSPADQAYATAGAQTAAGAYKTIADMGAQANAKIAGFKQIDRLLGNFEGGKLAPTGLDLASAANSIGFKMDPKMQNAQAADAISKQLVLSLSGGSLGTGFSNADRTFMEAQVPSLLQSAGGRRQVVAIGIATAQRQQDVAAKARAWQDRFGRIDAPDGTGKHFQDYLDAWSEAHPVFSPRQ